jgi:hypothetical protein
MEAMATSETSERNSQARIGRSKYRRLVPRPILDALGAGLLFMMLTAICTSIPVKACPFSGALAGLGRTTAPQAVNAVAEPGPAPIIEIATTSSGWDQNAVFRRTSGTAAWGLLGLAFSLLTALNLSFFRHLRRVYASPQAHHQDVQ